MELSPRHLITRPTESDPPARWKRYIALLKDLGGEYNLEKAAQAEKELAILENSRLTAEQKDDAILTLLTQESERSDQEEKPLQDFTSMPGEDYLKAWMASFEQFKDTMSPELQTQALEALAQQMEQARQQAAKNDEMIRGFQKTK